MGEEAQSLVKYSKAILFGKSTGRAEEDIKRVLEEMTFSKEVTKSSSVGLAAYLTQLENGITIEDLLNVLITPRCFVEEQSVWVQTPVTFPATVRDVVSLAESLRSSLKQKDAKQFGVCGVRYQLYMDSLDEIIRQVVIGYKSRGILLSCVRDYYASLFHRLHELYVSNTAAIVRKSIQNFQFKSKLDDEIGELRGKNAALREEVARISQTIKEKKGEFALRQEEFVRVAAEKRAQAVSRWESLRLEFNS